MLADWLHMLWAEQRTIIMNYNPWWIRLQDSTPMARRFFNALAEEPETAAAELVPRIRSIRVRM